MTRNVLVTGAGGFIGGHLVGRLLADGDAVTAVDVKPRVEWHQAHLGALCFDRLDCAGRDQLGIVNSASGPYDEVYHLAADMGGIGFIEGNKLRCMLSVLITVNVLRSAVEYGWERVFYASSACVYPAHLQREADVAALREHDAYPADPEDGYGWEKLFGERLARHFGEETGVETRVARYHNVYGPYGTWDGGREKSPAAICRKVAELVLRAERGESRLEDDGPDNWITVWGDGKQTRSFTYVTDAVEGTLRLMRSDVREPLNVGSSELVTIDQLVDVVALTAGVDVEKRYLPDAPKGVRGRNSDNALIRRHLDWEPTTSLASGIASTYAWVADQVRRRSEALVTATPGKEVTA